ncbi:non-ribosomal peptide synthetase [Rhodococcus sp. ARC_M5]|uniref:non-ribosomal peptide synthetase n=1 Tax=Rhodococcus sp. ARC_M5 TaxID=2928851 RepID=UPI001FB1C1E3|nr:non-ribosomal peptide synthetase [Rhodococcus sp. ARC_M5]MCJ0890810.1 amino acid adenylation domain-containing protein [Rhodococcus sp. ARC_M5]
MVVGNGADRARSADELRQLVAAAARMAPSRSVLQAGETSVSLGELDGTLDRIDGEMGGVLGADSLLPLALAELGLLDDADGAYERTIAEISTQTGAVVGVDPTGCSDNHDQHVVEANTTTLLADFEHCVARCPDRTAVTFEDRSLTYRELDRASNRVARHLLDVGVTPDRAVGLAMRRSLDLVVAMYGIIKAGGAYIPLDTEHPTDRLTYMLDTARPVVVIADRDGAAKIPPVAPVIDIGAFENIDDRELTEAERPALNPDSLAYVIFTSGSTGRPKAVAVSHSAITANLRWRQREYALDSTDVVLQKTPFTFDVSVWEFFWPLQVGAQLLLAEPGGHLDPVYLAELIFRRGVTVVHFVPSMLAIFVDTSAVSSLASLRHVFASGEELPSATAARFEAVSGAQLHNLYGPTETAVDVTYHPVHANGSGPVPIGMPVDDTELRVLDSGLHPVPPGAVGELYITGVQLARGYMNSPVATASRFLADPFGSGSRMYRTGDLVRQSADGVSTFLGRTDFQVKLRGLRIELGEIESVLGEREDVSQCVVVVREDTLVAYVVPTRESTVDPDDIKKDLGRRLPAYMVPTSVRVLDSMPLGPSGKLDRGGLPALESVPTRFVEPRTDTEATVAAQFGGVLGVGRVGRDDDFFALGGNSLDATRLIARLNELHDVRVSVRDFFDCSTVAGTAALIETVAGSPEPPRPLLASRQPWPEHIPLSYPQQRMWFLHRLDPQSSVDNIASVVRLTGRLDVDSFEKAVGDVVFRHAPLRTRYPEIDGRGSQAIESIDGAVIDFLTLPIDESDIARRVEEAVRAPFDLSQKPPFRVRLLAMDGLRHMLVVVVHHITADGYSMIPLTRDVMTAYEARTAGETPGWQPLSVQYPDYTLWQRDTLGSSDDSGSMLHTQEAYWASALSELTDPAIVPTDRPRPAVSSGRGARHVLTLNSSVAEGIADLARRSNVTSFMVVHAALAVLLARISDNTDIVVGTPVAGRGEAALDDMIGMFVNTVVLRTTVGHVSSFEQVLASVRDGDLSAFANADVPFERVVEIVDPPRANGIHPIFHVLLAYGAVGANTFELAGLAVEPIAVDAVSAKFDLEITVGETRTPAGAIGIDATITYATDLFDATSVGVLAVRFVRVLESAIANPAGRVCDIELLGRGERAWLVEDLNATDHPVPSQPTLVSMFGARVAASPGAPAVTFGDTSLTYAEFADRVNRLARLLISRGAEPEVRIAVALERSMEMLISIYAIIESGAAYVPIDPGLPPDRISYMLETSGSALVLADSDGGSFGAVPVIPVDGVRTQSFSGEPVTDEDRRALLLPENAAYVLFTSGSTGRPKGVTVSHEAIVNRLVWMQARYGIEARDIVVQKTPVTFDVSVWELFWPLQIGARLVIARPDGHRDPVYLAELMGDEGVTVAHFVPSMLAVFAAEPKAAHVTSLRWLFSSGEALPATTARAATAVLSSAVLVNLYGPTEAAVDVTHHEFSEVDVASVPIGRPVFNTRVYVLDSRLRPAPTGAQGELYLGGIQLARGYVARPDLTADRFVADPFGTGTRLYRTGDVARWTASGDLEYVGRADFQVKLRGLRIELGEIENALMAQPSVSQAAVTVYGDRLIAYVIPDGPSLVDVDSLKKHAAITLPDYMIPSTVLVLDTFPTGPTGKLDRKALPKPVFETREFSQPVTETERIVAGVFADVLGSPRVGRDDDFFALGGNSLIATQVVARVGALVDGQVPVRALFDASTVAGLASIVEKTAGSGGRIPLETGRRPSPVPLSPAQQRMWFLDRFEPDSAAYTIPVVVRLNGQLDVSALAQAIDDVRDRHESLRTVYPEIDGVGHQETLSPADSPSRFDVADCSEDEAHQLIRDMIMGGFDLAVAAPFRAGLYRLSDSEYVLAVVVHHIAADGFSVGPLMRDVVGAYSARMSGSAPDWEPLPVQYADYAVWQRDMLGDEGADDSLAHRQIHYWTGALEGIPEQLDLPTDRPRPAVPSERGGLHAFDIGAHTHRSIVALGLELGCTPFMVVHAAFAILLGRMSGTEDVAIGTPIAGRGERVLDDLIGMFVNTLVLRVRVPAGMTFEEMLTEVRERDLDAFANSDVPFERLVEILDPPRSTARQPLFQVMLAFQNLERSTVELPGIAAAGMELETGLSKFDLYLTISERFDGAGEPQGMIGQFLYLTDLFDEETVGAMGVRFLRIVEAVVTDPAVVIGDIDLLVGTERRTVLEEWSGTATETDQSLSTDELLLDRFQERTRIAPDAVAISFEHRSLSYGEFAARVDRLARLLISRGVGPETVVAVGTTRSVEMLVGIYAVLAAGAAYVPLDPGQPSDRVRRVVRTAGVAVLLAIPGEQWDLDEVTVIELNETDDSPDSPAANIERRVRTDPDSAAYVLFTSGSTGQPKGVTVSHRAIVNRLNWMQTQYGLGREDVVVQKTPATFDVSVWELFWPLQIGATLVIAAPGGHRDPRYLADLFETRSVTVAHFVPSMLSLFAAESTALSGLGLRWVFASGEALPASTARRLTELLSGVRLANLYGPTEAAVDVTFHEFQTCDTAGVPIGRPVTGNRVYVLDQRLSPVPPGVVGELYLAGVQLARGYASMPELTAERFVADPLGGRGERAYRTGDMVRWNRDGELEYVGRRDQQIKLRGQRIELGDVEAALVAHPAVAQAAAVLHNDSMVGDTLVGYVVAETSSSVDPADVRRVALARVPAYMVPTTIGVLAALPVGPNGKLDRKALPEPEFAVTAFRKPSTLIEEAVAEVFADLLGVPRVGLDDDFFVLGGNSLIATRVVARLGVSLDTTVPLRTLFEAPDVASLAARIENGGGRAGRPAITARSNPDANVPLSLAQQRMWFLNRLDPDSAVHNVPVTIRLDGDLDVVAFRRAFQDVIDRHDILRTAYPDIDGIGYQTIEPDPSGPVLRVEDVTAEQLPAVVRAEVNSGFDVTRNVPIRAVLLRQSSVAHVLVLVAHHISVDGFSVGPLTRDLVRAYAARTSGQVPGWEPLALQYADYAVWQRGFLGSEDDSTSQAAAQVAYWTERLADLPEQLDLPFDHARPAQATGDGAATTIAVDSEMRSKVSQLALEVGATPFMVVHAALAVLLAKLSGSADIAVGTPVAGRGDTELDNMIGMFVNTLVLRTGIDQAASFVDVVGHVRDVDLSAFSNADIPFERVVDAVARDRSRARHPLVQVMLTFQNLGQAHLELPGLTISGIEQEVTSAKFDLQVTVSDSLHETGLDPGWHFEFVYATELFEQRTMDAIVAGFVRVLSGLLASPKLPIGDIAVAAQAELDMLVQDWRSSGTDRLLEHDTLIDAFAATAALSPDSIAVRYDGRSVSYGELVRRVDTLARRLIEVGAQPDRVVAVSLPRSIELIVALLAVSASGAAYLPIDPAYPADRIEFMVDDAQPVVAVTAGAAAQFGSVPVVDVGGESTGSADPGLPSDLDRTAPLTSENMAYVIYTSGSSGRPKGVAVTHGNVLRLFANTASMFSFDADDVWTMFHSYAFDFSVWEMWGPLIHGGTLVIVDYLTSRSPDKFHDLVVDEHVTVLNQTPSAFHQFAEVDRSKPADSSVLRYVLFGGEALEPRRLRGWIERHGDGSTVGPGAAAPGPALLNLYGITETTVHVTTRRITSRDLRSTSVIGVPIPGLRVYVLDRRLRPVAVGVAGEMYVAGGQLAQGYLGRAALSATRFVADPFDADGGRLYRTGDRARWVAPVAPDTRGELEYLGRIDLQVKVRGFRIELGEVEAAVASLEEVSAAAVVVREDSVTGDSLVAYVVLVDTSADLDRVRRGVAVQLPDYMVPSFFVAIDAIPLTVNGKLDRKALPAPINSTSIFRPPATDVERAVATVYEEVLGLDRVGADDDFFLLGGNSLGATRVVARLSALLNTTVTVRLLFEASTVAELAVRLSAHVGTGARPALTRKPRPYILPLSYAQQRMWIANRLDPGSTAYNISLALRLSGSLDTFALADALRDVVERHETLRTRYPEVDGVGSQQILHVDDVDLELDAESIGETEAALRIRTLVATTFDVTAAVPVLARLLRISGVEHLLVLVVHHIAADGFSIGPLTQDLMTAYSARCAGRPLPWQPLEVQYADYALWHRRVLGDDSDSNSNIYAQERFWRRTLADLPEQSGIVGDRPRTSTPTRRGASHEFVFDSEIVESMTSVARSHNATLFMALHCAVAVLQAKLSGDEDVAIGTPVAGRGESALDMLVGMFVNTLALRTPVPGAATLTEVLESIRDRDLDAFAHADVPFERVVDLLDPPRSVARSPFFDVVVALQNHEPALLDLEGLSISGLDSGERTANYDLQFIFSTALAESEHSVLTCSLVYAQDLYDPTSVETLALRLTSIVRTLAQAPDTTVHDIDIRTEAEREETRSSPSSDAIPISWTLPQMMDTVVEAEPDAPAIVSAGEELRYLEVSQRAARLARYLVSRHIGPGDHVSIDMPFSADYVVTAWAVWQSGASIMLGEADRHDAVVVSMASTTRERPDGPTISLRDPEVTAAIALQSTRPVDFASRTGQLDADATAVLLDGSLRRVVTQRESLVAAAAAMKKWSVTYESRLLVASPRVESAERSGTDTADSSADHTPEWLIFALLVALSAGAALVMDESTLELSDVIEQNWVTHVISSGHEDVGQHWELEGVIETDSAPSW